jgi:hypothetical protein
MIRMIQRIDTEEPPWSLSESKRETLPIGYGPGARGVLEADRQSLGRREGQGRARAWSRTVHQGTGEEHKSEAEDRLSCL